MRIKQTIQEGAERIRQEKRIKSMSDGINSIGYCTMNEAKGIDMKQ